MWGHLWVPTSLESGWEKPRDAVEPQSALGAPLAVQEQLGSPAGWQMD